MVLIGVLIGVQAFGELVPLVFWNVAIFRQAPGFIRVTTFMSADKRKTDHIVETGPTVAGPWRELKRHL